MLTVVFGLFHGLLLLPVILSCIGPVGQENTGIISMDTSDTDNNNVTSVGDDDRGLDNSAFQPEVNLENQNFHQNIFFRRLWGSLAIWTLLGQFQ